MPEQVSDIALNGGTLVERFGTRLGQTQQDSRQTNARYIACGSLAGADAYKCRVFGARQIASRVDSAWTYIDGTDNGVLR